MAGPRTPRQQAALQARREKFFSEPVPKLPSGARSTKGFSELFPRLDMGHPHQFAQAVRNIVAVHDVTPEHVREQGRHWYEAVHEATAKGMRGKTHGLEHGAGLVAAVSAGMDWRGRNIHAIKELHSFRPEDWDVVHRHLRGEVPRAAVAHMLGQRGPSMRQVTSENLARAHQILQGTHPLEILQRRTSPKEHGFWHNIVHPDVPTHVTVDFRAHDVAAGERWPSDFTGRGLESAQLQPYSEGKPRPLTRYEHLENAYRAASRARGIELPQHMQAITWEGAKHIETRGGKLQRGESRYGQPYV